MVQNADMILTEDLFKSITDFIYRYSGLYFGEDARYILERRLQKRILQLHLNSFRKYYYHLLYDRDGHKEVDSLVDLLTTNETYFFREKAQLKAFIEEIIPELTERKKQQGSRTIKLWSAGCSTGEEPYTIAMLILEKKLLSAWDISIQACDINKSVLQNARTGIYRESAFRSTEPYFKRKYFDDLGDNTYKIKDEVRRLINFGWVNLYDEKKSALVGNLDVIFCRNVIIYFDREAKRKVIDSFYENLNQEGYLLLGHSESLLNITTNFKLKHLKYDMVYQK